MPLPNLLWLSLPPPFPNQPCASFMVHGSPPDLHLGRELQPLVDESVLLFSTPRKVGGRVQPADMPAKRRTRTTKSTTRGYLTLRRQRQRIVNAADNSFCTSHTALSPRNRSYCGVCLIFRRHLEHIEHRAGLPARETFVPTRRYMDTCSFPAKSPAPSLGLAGRTTAVSGEIRVAWQR